MPGGPGLRVLLVEDTETDRWFMAEMLRSRGHTVVACESGEDAWDAFVFEPPDLLVLDLLLPGMDGIELCRRIRDHDEGAPVVILVTTARDDAGVLHQVLEAGADDFVAKPVEPTLLAVRLAIAEKQVEARRARRAAEEALHAKTRELEALFDNLDDVFFSLDARDNRLIQISAAVQRIFQVPETEFRKPAVQKRFFSPLMEGEVRARVEAAEPGVSVRAEYPIQRPDRTTRWIQATVKGTCDAEGTLVRIDGILSDVTEQREAREELARRNEELEALYAISEVTLTASTLSDAYDRTLEIVAEATSYPIAVIEHLDREHDRMVVTAAYGLPGHDDEPIAIPLHRCLSAEAVRTGKPTVILDPSKRPDYAPEIFQEIKVRVHIAFPLTASGKVVGTLVLADTEKRAPEERLLRWGANLATTVAAYAERLEAEGALRENEARYRRLAAELQQANQELESFAYSVSHDLRAPLRTMQGFAHALLQNFGDSLDPEARDYARRIIVSGQRAEILIRDLLAYSRLSFEEIELKPVDLNAALAAAREQVQADFEQSGAHLEVRGTLPTVLGHHTTVVQVLANLLSNAVKFVPPEREPEVRVHAEESDDHVRLWIEDNGIGIPEGQEERIFRVFERLTEGGDHPGTGIGLAIVRRGMQRIGGSAGVEHRDEGGSAFWIELPKVRRRAWRPWGRRE